MGVRALALGVALLSIPGCLVKDEHANAVARDARATRAVCTLLPQGGSAVRGRVEFVQEDGGVRIRAEVTGLSPGRHAFHVHQWGDLEDAKAAACADIHFDPFARNHGAPDAAERHAGDLGNLVADASGRATFERIERLVRLSGAGNVIGRSIVVHQDADDPSADPAGNAGAALAAGVIGIAAAE